MSFWSKIVSFFKGDESGDSCQVPVEPAAPANEPAPTVEQSAPEQPAPEQPVAPVEEAPADEEKTEENPPQV